MGSYRRAIIVISIPLPRELCELLYLVQKPSYKYLDQVRHARIKRSESLILIDHTLCCICSKCYRLNSPGCKLILNYIASALPDRGILDDPERRDTLMKILRRLNYSNVTHTLKRIIDSGRLPWGKQVFVFDSEYPDIISPTELMEEIRDSVPIPMYSMQSFF